MSTAAGASASYVFDAEGRRVRKTVGSTVTDYFYAGTELLAEKQGASWTDYIFFGGQRIAQASGASGSTRYYEVNHPFGVIQWPVVSTTYYHGDHLGSSRMMTAYEGYPLWQATYLPFGQEWNPQATVNHFKFTGLERDAESGLDHTWFRQYSSNQGRWLSPDPLFGSPGDPQSLNRYAHVLNNPVNLFDPYGLQCSNGTGWSLVDVVHWNITYVGWPDDGGYWTESSSTEHFWLETSSQPCGPERFGGDRQNGPGGNNEAHSTGPNPPPPMTCGVQPTEASVLQYLSAVASSLSMFGQFLSGMGQSDLTFSPGSVESQNMASSPGLTQAVNIYLNTGNPTGLYTFGLSGAVAAGANPTQQFVGSFTYNVTPVAGGLNVTLSNFTSVNSGSYHVLPSHQRSSFGPMGTTHQTYQVFVPCHN